MTQTQGVPSLRKDIFNIVQRITECTVKDCMGCKTHTATILIAIALRDAACLPEKYILEIHKDEEAWNMAISEIKQNLERSLR